MNTNKTTAETKAFSYARGVASFAGARIGPAHE